MSSSTTKASGQQLEGRLQVGIMLTIGLAGAAASFTHVHDVAFAHGQADWLAWADAIVLELMSIASGLEMRRRKRAHQSTRMPFGVLLVAVTLSLSAQILEAEPTAIGWIAASVPALGFLAMAKMALGRKQAGEAVAPVVAAVPAPAAVPVPPAPAPLAIRVLPPVAPAPVAAAPAVVPVAGPVQRVFTPPAPVAPARPAWLPPVAEHRQLRKASALGALNGKPKE